ncbi:serine/threonine protein kinase [Maridesulfovibrio ferrireducens]|uniref:serine/threonine protein kinase n=1 Tax=Maridesulfovibrio ferrireducens TaxID=246191 RepID=UPI001A1987A6|nr:serine/threonine protein kinase [Maridesulfovibrio ferrireducens]MBI9110202.1 serine/threonine protein kinase [Maridesulfovibrio ferrireducens]
MSSEVRDLLHKYLPDYKSTRFGKIYTDTTEFMNIDHSDVIKLGDQHFLVLKNEEERRFGLVDPKYWVKRGKHLESGQPQILKLAFYEKFPMNIGPFKIECYRSPRKEARILELVKGDMRFMQGCSNEDEVGNNVRVLDIIRGKRLDIVVHNIPVDHKTYFYEYFPDILEKYIGSCEAIKFLHDHDEKHGDVRRDHLWVESGTGDYRWIDFDYAFELYENPFGLDVFGLGSILIYLVGKANFTMQTLLDLKIEHSILETLNSGDYSVVIGNRVVNVRKIYSYIPESLNNILMHFSSSSTVFYESVDELLFDMRRCLKEIRGL